MAAALDEVTAWLGDKPDELALLYVWDCQGDDCMDAAKQALAKARSHRRLFNTWNVDESAYACLKH